MNKTLCEVLNEITPNLGNGFQNGVKPGVVKFMQFETALRVMGTPPAYAQDGKGENAIAYVKIFDPCGSWSWFITEYNPAEKEAFGLVKGFETELGYMSLVELAAVKGQFGIGLELDMHWTPRTIAECRKE